MFYFQQVLKIPLLFTEKFSLLFFLVFHFLHHSAQEFSYFIYFIVYLKLLLFYFWPDRYSKSLFDLQKIFLFFFFGFAREMKCFVWTWFSTTISFSNLSMWIKSFFLQASVSSYLTIHQCFYVLVSDYRIINFISQHGQISYCEMSVTNFSRSWLFVIVHLHLVNVFFTKAELFGLSMCFKLKKKLF